MSIDNEVGDILTGSGAPALKFPTIGTTHKGKIEAASTGNVVDPANGKVKTFADGNPMKQVVVTLATDQKEGPDDDGMRRLFVKGQMIKAVSEAMKKVGAKTLEVGGELAVKYASDGEKSNPAYNAPKQYVAEYKTPVASVDVDSLL